MALLEKLLISKVIESKFDEVHLLNSSKLGEAPFETQAVVESLLNKHKKNFRKNKNDLTFSVTIDNIQQLGGSIDHLNKRLQEHTFMLKKNEGSLSGTSTVLEFDSAKTKADKLAEILRAKIVWSNIYAEIQLLEPTDRTLRYQKLVALQKSFDILHKYSPNITERENNFEKMKDEFLSWFSSATVLAIDSNDLKQVESLCEKFFFLNRFPVFEQIFGTYSKNKIKCFIEEDGKKHSMWDILQEVFTIWRRCYKLSKNFVDANTSKLIAQSLKDAVLTKWEIIANLITTISCSSESPFKSANEFSKMCNDFLAYAKSEGDEEIYNVCEDICQRIISVLSEDYSKHVTSVLLCTVNKISSPAKDSCYNYNWMLPYIDEIHSCMREMINEAKSTFGGEFPQHIVPSFEQGLKEINALILNKDILNIKGNNTDIRVKKSVHENTEDKISAMCVTGALLNIVDHINIYIIEKFRENEKPKNSENPQLISNRSMFEELNQKVLAQKVEAIANFIIYTMHEEIIKLKLESASKSSQNNNESMQISLPSFSISPHNYITNVGHGLLNAMNTISLYASNNNFVCAIMSIASKSFSEDEVDLWILTEIGAYVIEAFCQDIGNVALLNVQLARQFNADVIFLMEALVDLRLQPTPRLIECAAKLKELNNA